MNWGRDFVTREVWKRAQEVLRKILTIVRLSQTVSSRRRLQSPTTPPNVPSQPARSYFFLTCILLIAPFCLSCLLSVKSSGDLCIFWYMLGWLLECAHLLFVEYLSPRLQLSFPLLYLYIYLFPILLPAVFSGIHSCHSCLMSVLTLSTYFKI